MSMITMLSKYVLILSLLMGQTAMGIYVNAMRLMGNAGSASSSPSILVGPGFTDVSPHEIVRTSANVLYTVAPTCDSSPGCVGSTLRVFRANQSGTPVNLMEQDAAHAPTNVGSAAIAIDSTDTIHALWNDGAGNLNYRTFSTVSDLWIGSITRVAATNWTTFSQGDEGVALALDGDGVPHAVWSGISSGTGGDGKLDVWYANKSNGWSAPQRVDDVTLTGNRRTLHPTIAFTPTNDLLVTWLDGTFNYDLSVAGIIRVRTRSSAGSWAATQTINDPDGAMTTIDNGPSLLITPDGTIHLTFVAFNPPDQVRYWYNPGDGWHGDLQPPVQITHDPSLGPDGNGGIRIYGHGTPAPSGSGDPCASQPYTCNGENLYLFHKAMGGSWEPWTLYATGSFDSSVSTRWAQFFQSFPQTLDIAYWADTSPNTLYVGTDASSSAMPAAFPQPRLTTVIPGVPVFLPIRRSPTATTQVAPQPLPIHR